MAQRNETILDVLAVLRWWVSVIVAGAAYYTLKYYFLAIESSNLLIMSLGKAGPTLAPWAALFFLLPAPVSLFNSKMSERYNEREEKEPNPDKGD